MQDQCMHVQQPSGQVAEEVLDTLHQLQGVSSIHSAAHTSHTTFVAGQPALIIKAQTAMARVHEPGWHLLVVREHNDCGGIRLHIWLHACALHPISTPQPSSSEVRAIL